MDLQLDNRLWNLKKQDAMDTITIGAHEVQNYQS